MKLNKDTLKGVAIVLVALALIYAVTWIQGLKKATVAGFTSIDSYIGACQKAGLLPTPQALQERLAQIEAQKQAEQEKK